MSLSSLRLLPLARMGSLSVLLRQIPSRSLSLGLSPRASLLLPPIRSPIPFQLASARFLSKKTPKKEKGGKKAAAASDDDEDEEEKEEGGEEEGGEEISVAELLKQADEECAKAMEKFREHFNSLRIGGASPGLLDPVIVEIDGEKKPLKAVAQVSVKDPQNLLVTVFALEHLKPVTTGIQVANLGFTPQLEKSNSLKVPIPKVTKEFRQAQAKMAAKMAEQAKVEIRDARHNFLKKTKSESSAAKVKLGKDIQKVADKYTEEVEAALKAKTQELEGKTLKR